MTTIQILVKIGKESESGLSHILELVEAAAKYGIQAHDSEYYEAANILGLQSYEDTLWGSSI